MNYFKISITWHLGEKSIKTATGRNKAVMSYVGIRHGYGEFINYHNILNRDSAWRLQDNWFISPFIFIKQSKLKLKPAWQKSISVSLDSVILQDRTIDLKFCFKRQWMFFRIKKTKWYKNKNVRNIYFVINCLQINLILNSTYTLHF